VFPSISHWPVTTSFWKNLDTWEHIQFPVELLNMLNKQTVESVDEIRLSVIIQIKVPEQYFPLVLWICCTRGLKVSNPWVKSSLSANISLTNERYFLTVLYKVVSTMTLKTIKDPKLKRKERAEDLFYCALVVESKFFLFLFAKTASSSRPWQLLKIIFRRQKSP